MERIFEFVHNDEIATVIASNEDFVRFSVETLQIGNEEVLTDTEVSAFVNNLKVVLSEVVDFSFEIETDERTTGYLVVTVSKK